MRTNIFLGCLISTMVSCTLLNRSPSTTGTKGLSQAKPSTPVNPSNRPQYLDAQTLFVNSRFENCPSEGLPILGRSFVEYIFFENIDQLIKEADLIVVGRPLTELGPNTTLRSMKAKKNYGYFKIPVNQSLVVTDSSGASTRGADWTLISFAIEKILKGKPISSEIQILESGIVISGKSIAKHIQVIGDTNDYTPLRKGKKYLLFLKKTLPTPTSFFDSDLTYSSIGLHQGKYNLDGGDCPEAQLVRRNPQHSKLLNQVKAKYPKLFSEKKNSSG
jgi:hypothetical protein